ncbi:MAG: peptidoglycan-binding protein [Corynebacterium sp.]|uniref:peptidoglycan-binding domain-containing protein n=1 Tax=Corynebacterium sp. TaxID=1720 RepID=UPI0026475F69|nr:peptidoglycan-binding domain-containing protein [Corynebacterium sp.]MDN6284021.1 peptidoglycan-binding protein [Corynebacterium sp.]
MATWLSGVKRQSWGRDGGSFTTSPDKILLHSTETGTFPGYGRGASAPHFTINLGNGEVRQHSPMNRAARALRNASGGVQTNRDGVIQIEIIGTCDKSFARKHGYPYLPDMTDEMAGRLKWLLQKICAAIPAIPLTTSVAWKSYPSSYGNSSVRMSNSQWTRYKGILGHQHAPENTHGDPGDLPMEKILGADAVKSGGSSGGGSDYTVVGPDAPLGLYDKDGDGRTRVEDWQKDALGYSGKAADGYFGSDTKDDTKALQRQIGVTDDGLVGDDTTAAWEKAGKPKLKKESKSKPSNPSGDAPGPGYDFPWPKGHYIGPKDGPDRSHSGFYKNKKWSGKYDEEWLKALPEQLIRRGWSIGKGKTYLSKFGNDGHYGSEYAALIRAFQNTQGLAVDELGGREVWDEAFKRPVT